MPHANDGLRHDLGSAVLAEEVVDVRDGARVRVLDRHDGGVGLVCVERREDLGERAARQEARSRKKRRRGCLRERAGETLVGDGGQRYTAVRHSACRLSSPCARAKYLSPIFFATGPILPSPITRPSILTQGATCAPVPQKKTSSATYSSVRSIFRSPTTMPSSAAIVRIESRVIPSRMSSVTDGVISAPSRTMKMFAPPPSETWPSAVRKIASSASKSCASSTASAVLMYAPVSLPRAGIASSDVRRQLAVL